MSISYRWKIICSVNTFPATSWD